MIYEIHHILNCGCEITAWTQFLQLRMEAWKIQDFNGVWTPHNREVHSLLDFTSAVQHMMHFIYHFIRNWYASLLGGGSSIREMQRAQAHLNAMEMAFCNWSAFLYSLTIIGAPNNGKGQQVLPNYKKQYCLKYSRIFDLQIIFESKLIVKKLQVAWSSLQCQNLP